MSGKARPIRHEVVELLLDASARSDLSRWPWRNLVHSDGRSFSAAEAELANSATMTEAVTAHRLAIESFKLYQRRHDDLCRDLCRAQDLLASVPGWEAMEFGEIAASLPPEQQEEMRTLARLYPEELGDMFPEDLGLDSGEIPGNHRDRR